MLPAFAMDNAPYDRSVDVEFSGYVNLACSVLELFANGAHRVLSQYRSVVCFAEKAWIVAPPLAYHVVQIFALRTQKQMCGVYALTIVAFMANLKAVWDRAVVYFPGYAMRQMGRHVTVAILCNVALPFPAGVGCAGRIYHSPESLLERFVNAVSIDKTYWLSFYPAAAAVSAWRKIGFLPTTAVAVTVRDFVRGIIGVHENLHSLAKPPNDSTRCGGNFIGCYSFNYSTNGLETVTTEGK